MEYNVYTINATPLMGWNPLFVQFTPEVGSNRMRFLSNIVERVTNPTRYENTLLFIAVGAGIGRFCN